MFRLLQTEELIKIRNQLQKRLPKCAQLYNAVQLMISEAFPPEIVTKFYSFKGNEDSHANSLNINEVEDKLFVVAVQYREDYAYYDIILSCPDSPSDEMISAFESLVDWTRQICFCAVDVCVCPIIAKLCQKHGKLSGVDPCDMMTMSIESAKAVQVVNTDPDVSVRELDPSDGELVTKRWKYSEDGTESLMKLMIRSIGSAGVYVKSKLVCWIVMFSIGSMNALYTEDEFRKKGYARLTMQKICKTAGDRSLVPNVQIQKGNLPSTRLMESVGFKFSHEVEWIDFSTSEK